MKRFSATELAALGAALAMIGELEPGDAVLEENEDGSITANVFGEHFVTGTLDRVIGQVAQAMWRHGYDRQQAPAHVGG